MDREVMEDIVQTGKRYQGYGVNLREYCAGIGISASRWFRITKAWCHKVSMGNENFFGKKIESDFLNTKRKRGGNHDEGQANVQS